MLGNREHLRNLNNGSGRERERGSVRVSLFLDHGRSYLATKLQIKALPFLMATPRVK